MESRFFVEAKSFSFSVEEGKSTLCVEERRRGFLGSVFLGPRGVDWLLDILEELLRSSGSEDFSKSIRVDSKALTVKRGGNRNGRFLVVTTQAVDDRRNIIVLPEGREGRGWGRFAGELSKVKDFFEATIVPPSGSGSVVGCSTSHAVVGEVAVHQEHVLDLFQMKTCRDVEAGRMAVDCFELERQPPRPTNSKMTSGSPLDGGKVRKMKKGGFFSFWRLLVKWVRAAVKPKFRVKPKLKPKKTCEVGPAELELDSGSELDFGLDKMFGSDHDFGSDLPDSNPFSGSDLGSGPVSVAVSGSPPSGYVSEFFSPPLPDQLSPMKATGVAPVKPLDEGPLGATGLVPVMVAVGSVLPAVEVGSVRHSFPVKGMLRRGFLGSKIAPSPALSPALASSSTSEVIAVPAMVSVGSKESEDGHVDLDPDPDPEKCAVGLSPLDFCTFDTAIDTTSVELTDTQIGLIERMRKELKVNDTTKVVLKHIEEIFLRVNKGVRDGVLPAEEGESLLAFHFEQIEKFLSGKLVEQPRIKGKRERRNLESSINYGIAPGPSRTRRGKVTVM
jgi:hypothetical protein